MTKIAIWLGIVATIPTALLAGFLIADPFYMRFIFEGERKDFAPGDAIGTFLYAWVFAVLILIPAMLGWWRLYRKVR